MGYERASSGRPGRLKTMSDSIPMTPEQIKDYGVIVGQYVLDHAKSPVKEPRYKLDDPKIQELFPGLSVRTLQDWCLKAGKKKGIEGCYRVTLSEIDRMYSEKKSK
jgi:hypothetical protein